MENNGSFIKKDVQHGIWEKEGTGYGEAVVIQGEIERLHKGITVNRYPCAAAVEITGGWFVEFASQKELAGYHVGDSVEITGHVTDIHGSFTFVLLHDGYPTTIKKLDN